MVSPLIAVAIVSRSDPDPWSASFRTVSVLGTVLTSSPSSLGTNRRRGRRLNRRRSQAPWGAWELPSRRWSSVGNGMMATSLEELACGKVSKAFR